MLPHSGKKKKKHSHMHALFSHLILSIKPFKNKTLKKKKTLSLNATWHYDLQSKQNSCYSLVLDLQWPNHNEAPTTNTQEGRLLSSTASRLPVHPLSLSTWEKLQSMYQASLNARPYTTAAVPPRTRGTERLRFVQPFPPHCRNRGRPRTQRLFHSLL